MQLAFQQTGAEFFPIPEPVVQDAYTRAKHRFAGGGATTPLPSSGRRSCANSTASTHPTSNNRPDDFAAGCDTSWRTSPQN
jgi:hypothetical protein